MEMEGKFEQTPHIVQFINSYKSGIRQLFPKIFREAAELLIQTNDPIQQDTYVGMLVTALRLA